MSFINASILNMFNFRFEIVLLLMFLSVASYTDIKDRKIYNNFNVLMLLNRVAIIVFLLVTNQINMLDTLNYLGGGLLLGMFYLIPAMILLKKMGGDIKFAFNVGLWIGVMPSIIMVSIITFLDLSYRIFFTRKEEKEQYSQKIPTRGYLFFKAKPLISLAPFFELSYIILLVYYLIFLN